MKEEVQSQIWSPTYCAGNQHYLINMFDLLGLESHKFDLLGLLISEIFSIVNTA